MLSLGAVKDGVILPSEDDRKRIITQMKVRTTLKGDKSWIQQRSDGEEEQNRSPLRSPVRSRGANGRSPVSPRNLSPNRRTTSLESPSQAELQSSPGKSSPPRKSPSATSPSGYLIRGVFTKTVDKTAPPKTAPNGSPKSAKTASLPRISPGYKMSTEEYKKLAPYNVKREPADPCDAERTVSSDEQKKRTEAASSVLRRTAGKERSYVFSAAKKSNGSPSPDALPFLAKRVDIEEDMGPRARSQTVPASGWFSSREKSSTNGEKRSPSESPWSEPRLGNAASTTSVDTGSRSQAAKPSSESASAFSHFSSRESSYRRSGDQEKSELLSRNDSAPKVTASPSKCSANGGKLSPEPGAEMRSGIFSEDSYQAKPQSVMGSPMPQSPRVTLSPEARGPKSRPSGHDRTRDDETAVETHHRSKVGEYRSDTIADFPRSALDEKEEGHSFRDDKYGSSNSWVSEFSEHQPVTARPRSLARDSMNVIPGERYSVPAHLGDHEDVGPSRSFSSFERKSTQEVAYESPSDTEYKRVEAHLAKTGSWSSESSFSTTGTQSEFLRAARREEPGLDTARSSSLSTESGVATPEYQQGEYGYDSDTARRVTSDIPETSLRTPSSYLDRAVYNSCVLESERRSSSPYLDCQPPNSLQSGTSHGMPSYLSNHSYSPSNFERSHGITSSYLSNQAIDSRRSYYPFRDNSAASSPRSHRVPFYRDVCDTEVGSGKGLLFVKESVNSTELSSSPRYNSRSMVDLSDLERSTYSSATSLNSSPPKRLFEDICTYCGREIRNCAKITIENLKICCHEYCFRCGICHKPMGDLLDKIFIHRDIVHCDKCYEKLF